MEEPGGVWWPPKAGGRAGLWSGAWLLMPATASDEPPGGRCRFISYSTSSSPMIRKHVLQKAESGECGFTVHWLI